MRVDILTLFPESFSYIDNSILGRARQNKILDINLVNIRDFSQDKHQKCDDEPFGGGAGMVMTPQPIYDAVKSVKTEKSKVIFLTPAGRTLNQSIVKELSEMEHIILICGHYEGVDQRVIDLCVDEEISIGDYILTGGELPAMVILDAISRYIPNVLHNSQSVIDESFSNNRLEYPTYTRPQVFEGLEVPAVLLSGNHKQVDDWRSAQSFKRTLERREDLLKGGENNED